MKIKLILLCACTLFLVSCKDDADPAILEGCCGNLPLNTSFGTNTRVYISNIFTPNGDNINDFMTLSSNSFVLVTGLEIKNKSGDVVHTYTSFTSSRDVSLWNGEINGVVQKGYYTYTLTVESTLDGSSETFEGGICNYPCDTDVEEERISPAGCTFPFQVTYGSYDSTIPSGEQNGCFAE